MRAGLSLKVGLATATVVAAALALATLLNALRFQETYERLVAERFGFVAAELRTLASIGLDFGLQLEGNAGLRAALEREAAADPGILAITIYGCGGEALLQAGAAEASRRPWQGRTGLEAWRLFSDQAVGVGLMIRDSIGLCAGGVAVEFSSAAYAATLAGSRRTLLLGVLPLALAALPLAALAAAFAFRRDRHVALALERDLAALQAGGGERRVVARARQAARGDPALRELVAAYARVRPLLAKAGPEPPQR